jgi:GDP-L-fucose synthase
MKLYVAGIGGMVGSAIADEARKLGFTVLGKRSKSLNLTNRSEVFSEMLQVKPDALIISAAKVGGIGANVSSPVDFLSVNLQIQTNLLDAAHAADIEKVVFLGSSCVYPKLAEQPIRESYMLTGPLDPNVSSYGIAKIAGIRLVESYRLQFHHKWFSVILTNLYGPKDNFDPVVANVLPGLMRRIHDAKVHDLETVSIWGDGTPLREFMYVGDLARAIFKLIREDSLPAYVNVGSGQEISIRELAELISEEIEFRGQIKFDPTRPNGTPRKLLDSYKLRSLGWLPEVNLKQGIQATYKWFVENQG